MGDWTVLVAAIAAGGALLATATLLDLRRRRRRDGTGRAPQRGVESVDAIAPTYVTQGEVDAMPLPATADPGSAPPSGTRLGFGHLGVEFATAGSRAIYAAPRILLIDGSISTMRELLPLLATTSPASAAVVVALGFADDVLATLRANRRALRTPVVAAQASRRDLYELAAVVDGEVLTEQDLRAGYIPGAALGRAVSWVSDECQLWVEVPPKA